MIERHVQRQLYTVTPPSSRRPDPMSDPPSSGAALEPKAASGEDHRAPRRDLQSLLARCTSSIGYALAPGRTAISCALKTQSRDTDHPIPRIMNANSVKEGDLLWSPSAQRRERANLTHYMNWLSKRMRPFESYGDLWEWSVRDQEGFWGSLFEYLGVRASTPYAQVLGTRSMPGAEWFPGARLNYAEHALRYERAGAIALVHSTEGGSTRTLSWAELGSSVRTLAERLRAVGLRPGDRVAAYLPNTPEALIAMLAVASIGAAARPYCPDARDGKHRNQRFGRIR